MGRSEANGRLRPRPIVLNAPVGVTRSVGAWRRADESTILLGRTRCQQVDFVNGRRVTDAAPRSKVVEDGAVGPSSTSAAGSVPGPSNGQGRTRGRGVGQDANLDDLHAKAPGPRLSGFVGHPVREWTRSIPDKALCGRATGTEIIPVIAPIGIGPGVGDLQRQTATPQRLIVPSAASLNADRLLLLTDVRG